MNYITHGEWMGYIKTGNSNVLGVGGKRGAYKVG